MLLELYDPSSFKAMTRRTRYDLIGPSTDTICCVLCMPWCGRFMCPFAVAGLGLRYFVTPFAVRLGHPLRYPRGIAFGSVEMRGLQRYW